MNIENQKATEIKTETQNQVQLSLKYFKRKYFRMFLSMKKGFEQLLHKKIVHNMVMKYAAGCNFDLGYLQINHYLKKKQNQEKKEDEFWNAYQIMFYNDNIQHFYQILDQIPTIYSLKINPTYNYKEGQQNNDLLLFQKITKKQNKIQKLELEVKGDIFWDDFKENLENLCSGLKNLRDLKNIILHLSCSDYTIEAIDKVQKFSNILKSLPQLNSIQIEFSNCSQNNPFSNINNFDIITGVYKDLTQIEYLKLGFFENFIGDNKDDIQIISKSLINLKNLKSFSINFGVYNAFQTKLGEDIKGIKMFTESIGNNLTQLKTLYLEFFKNTELGIKPQNLKLFGPMLKKLSHLQELNLGLFNTQLDEKSTSLVNLGNSLKDLNSIQKLTLNLGANNIWGNEKGIKSLKQGINSLKNLKQLNLNFRYGWLDDGADSWKVYVDIIKSLPELDKLHLNIHGCDLGDNLQNMKIFIEIFKDMKVRNKLSIKLGDNQLENKKSYLDVLAKGLKQLSLPAENIKLNFIGKESKIEEKQIQQLQNLQSKLKKVKLIY